MQIGDVDGFGVEDGDASGAQSMGQPFEFG
jgi:hypothetical protein